MSLTVCVLVCMAACGGGGAEGGEGVSTVANDAIGLLNISMTDAAFDDVSKVWVGFAGVTLKPRSADEMVIEFGAPGRIDLLDLQDGKTHALLAEEVVLVGPYDWIRLAVNAEFDNVYDPYAMLKDGTQVELRIPSGSQNGLKLVNGFTVTANQSTNILIDRDLRKALTGPRGQPGMHLRPALRLTDMAAFGTLTGTIAEAPVADEGCSNDPIEGTGNAVCVYEGVVDVPLDIRAAQTGIRSRRPPQAAVEAVGDPACRRITAE